MVAQTFDSADAQNLRALNYYQQRVGQSTMTLSNNHFLDADESDDDQSQGYDSEADEIQKGGRTAKRQRLEDELEDELSGSDDDQLKTGASKKPEGDGLETGKDKEENWGGASGKTQGKAPRKEKKVQISSQVELPGVSDPLRKKNLVATDAAIKKSGVIYLSRVPPFMKPQKLRSLLEPYGKTNRIFLSPEDPQAHSRRVRSGGNKKRLYTDGWVEFVNKKNAKEACELLNARTIGGKKGSYYRDDIWSLTYLKGFKWHNLTEQIAAEQAERASRLRAEISRTTKENKEFLRNMEKAKMLDGMESKKSAKRKRMAGEGNGDAADAGDAPVKEGARRIFRQAATATKEHTGTKPQQASILDTIF